MEPFSCFFSFSSCNVAVVVVVVVVRVVLFVGVVMVQGDAIADMTNWRLSKTVIMCS